MRYVISWTVKSLRTLEQPDSLIPNEEEVNSTSYFKGHDGIGNQWTESILYAKEFYSDHAAAETIAKFGNFNYDGIFAVEESISDSINTLSNI